MRPSAAARLSISSGMKLGARISVMAVSCACIARERVRPEPSPGANRFPVPKPGPAAEIRWPGGGPTPYFGDGISSLRAAEARFPLAPMPILD
ncbi:hypothetical protein GCM10011358_27000 [Sinisalibacter lacisalsi]|uniref:Secreted protein n=1 Tax=Sinisalibacter lacisalsi TaxID=1526570 RepID=A0ABQ1QR21_9RHOB|nr:hypothetical protein GCM10011358_27000 [Sinisalibacter lacisalsi]